MKPFVSEDFLQTLSSYRTTSQTIYHCTLGEFHVLQSPEGDKLLKKCITPEQLAISDLAIFEKYRALQYSRIVQFKGIIQEKHGGLTRYAMFYEHFEKTLKEEIEEKAAEGSRYTEIEILKILQNVSSSLAFMQSSKLCHGEIKSSNIVKVGQDYKVLNPVLFGKFLHLSKGPHPRLPKPNTKIISPMVLNALHRNILDPVHEDYKDDVYGLGLVALDMMTLIVDPIVPPQKRLERSNFFFSNTLVRFVKKMLEEVICLRLDPVSCTNFIEGINLQHGLVSVRRFTKGDRNHSVRERSLVDEQASGDFSLNISDLNENKHINQQCKTQESQYIRKTGSVTPLSRGWYNCLTVGNPTENSFEKTIDLKESEKPIGQEEQERTPLQEFTQFPMKVKAVKISLIPEKTPNGRASNKENSIFVKKEKPDEVPYDPNRYSTTSTNITTTQRLSRWEASRESSWNVLESPSKSNLSGFNKEILSLPSPINNSKYQVARHNINNKENGGSGGERLRLRGGERKKSKERIIPTKKLQLDLPPFMNISITPKSAISLEYVGNSESNYEEKKAGEIMKSGATTPYEIQDEGMNNERSFCAFTPGGTSNLHESMTNADIKDFSQILTHRSKAAENIIDNNDKSENTARSFCPPIESNLNTQEMNFKNIEICEDKAPLNRLEFNRGFVQAKLTDTSNDQILNTTLCHTKLPDISWNQSTSYEPTTMIFTKNNAEDSYSQRGHGLAYIEGEQSFDQTFAEPIVEALESDRLEPRILEPKSLMSYKICPPNHSDPSFTIDPIAEQPKIVFKSRAELDNGSFYEGEMLGSLRQGKGKIIYPNGRYYEGDWKFDQINGHGRLYNIDGCIIYDGQWQDGKYHGRGTLYNLKSVRKTSKLYKDLQVSNREEDLWKKYHGSFRENKWDGYGELCFKNGDRYFGEFRDDVIHGKGKLIIGDGKIWEGEWENNQLVRMDL